MDSPFPALLHQCPIEPSFFTNIGLFISLDELIALLRLIDLSSLCRESKSRKNRKIRRNSTICPSQKSDYCPLAEVNPKVPVYSASATRKTGPDVEQKVNNHRSARCSQSISLTGASGVAAEVHTAIITFANRSKPPPRSPANIRFMR